MAATLSVSAVRARIAALAEALTTPSNWTESKWPYGAFPAAEPMGSQQLTFAVGIPSSSFDSHIETSRGSRGANGGAAHSDVRIAWLYRIRADAARADYDAALDAEGVLLAALTVSTAHTSGLHISIDGASRALTGDGAYLLGEVRLTAQHRIAIQ